MKRVHRRQSGYALLVIMLGLLSMGGFAAAKFSEGARIEVEQQKLLHDRRVLREAREALLQFAFKYPDTDGNGPGHLPCADTDNNGQPNPAFGDCVAIGRLPWADPDLKLYDLRDSAGQRLWYMVSNRFATNASPNVPINGASFGDITIRNQTGAVLFDGSASNGVAAVIIAPGAPIARDGVMQVRQPANADNPFDTIVDTDPAILDADRYLDLVVGVEDNALANPGSADGFIVGPVQTPGAGVVLVNDRVAFITTAELIAVAEKATLRAYRDALTAYDARIDADLGNDDYYPWLYDYDVFEAGSGLGDEIDAFPSEAAFATEIANHLQNWGRVPSMFGRYFVDTDGEPIESELELSVELNDPTPPLDRVQFYPNNFNECPQSGTDECGPGDTVLLDFDTIETSYLTWVYDSVTPLDNMEFSSAAVVPPFDSSIRSNTAAVPSWNRDIYFWDRQFPSDDGWEICPDDPGDADADAGTTLIDCEGVHTALGVDIEVLKIIIAMPVVSPPLRVDLDYGALASTTILNAASGAGHARFRADFPIAASSLPLAITYEFDDRFDFVGSWDVDQSGTLELDDLAPLLRITMRYYPELPAWVKSEGWYQNVLFAYAQDYLPNVAGDCTIGTDCLRLNNLGGLVKNDKISILVYGGPELWDDEGDDTLADDLVDIFDAENFDAFVAETADADIVFDAWSPGGNDRAIVVCERTAGGSQCF